MIPTYLPVVGGAERNSHYLIKTTVALGIEPMVVTYNMPKRWNPRWRSEHDLVDSIPVVRCAGWRPYPNVKYVRAILPSLLGIHVVPTTRLSEYIQWADLLHFHDEVDLSFPLAAWNAKKPKVFHIRTLGVLFKSFRRFPSKRWLLRKVADVFVSISTASADQLLQLGIPSNRIHVVHNGLDTTLFNPGPFQPKHSRRLLFVGRLQKQKGLDVLLKALQSIADPVQMVIVLGNIGVQAYYEKVRWQAEALTRNHGHEFEWHFALPQKEVIPLYRSAQLIICPARNETLGNVCMEAMACGTPAVASRSGGFPELVDDGINGRLFEVDNSKELAGIITSLLDSPETIRDFSRKAFDKSRTSFTGERAAREMIDVYNRIV